MGDRGDRATAPDGSELPTKPLPVPPARALGDLLNSMTDMKAMHVPALIGIYGDQGTGKTVSGMTFLQAIVPKTQKILFVGTGAGWISLQNHPHLMERVKYMAYENMEQLTVLARLLRTTPQLREKIGGVMLDEYSVMSARDQAWIVRVRSEQALAENKFKDPFQPTLPDYLGQKLRSGEVVNDFLESQTHTVFIAHEKLDEIRVIQPDFPEKTGKDWQRLLHGVFHATVEIKGDKEYYPMQLKPFDRISAKNRIGGLGKFATIEQIAEAYLKWGITQDKPKATIELPDEEPVDNTESDEEAELLKLIGK